MNLWSTLVRFEKLNFSDFRGPLNLLGPSKRPNFWIHDLLVCHKKLGLWLTFFKILSCIYDTSLSGKPHPNLPNIKAFPIPIICVSLLAQCYILNKFIVVKSCMWFWTKTSNFICLLICFKKTHISCIQNLSTK